MKEAASWLRQQRERFLPKSAALDETQKNHMRPFFPEETLDRVRVVDASESGDSLPYPPFYERVRAGGERVLPDAAHLSAMAFIDVIVFSRQPTPRTLFHNLIHVLQFGMVGTDRVLEGYFKTLSESGLWMVVAFEEQAYQRDARYTRDPSDVFSVEKEIREWMRAGRF